VSGAVRPAIVLGTNLAVGTAVLGYVLFRYGAPAVALLSARLEVVWLVAFILAATVAVVVYALRWRIVLGGLDIVRRPVGLAAFRAAGHSVSSLLPSAKLGGEPLRAFLLVRDRVPASSAIASVAVDRTLEMGAAAVFACLYGAVLLRRGVPGLEGALVTVVLGGVALAAGIAVTVRRLGRGAGLVSALARATRLERLDVVRTQMQVLVAAEDDAARLIAQRRRIVRAFGAGLAANAVVLVEYHLLLAAFGLPAGPLAVVAAIFGAGAAHSLPVPAAVGALEGAEMWLFGTLGHPPEVGLAVGLAVRLRELVWIVPGVVYLLVRGLRVPVAGAGRCPQIAVARKPG